MKRIRILLLFAGLMGVAAVAEAQCYTCRNLRPMPWYQGTCIEGMAGVCSSQCCWQVYGTPCTLPDNDLWYCHSDPEGATVVANRYFTGPGLQQNNVLATVRKAGTLEVYRREVMKRRIPRRCPSTT
jgi:hypothetical protein